jgi:hypothetical protein
MTLLRTETPESLLQTGAEATKFTEGEKISGDGNMGHKKSAGGCGEYTRFIFIATPAKRPVLIGRAKPNPPGGRGKRFLKNNFRPDYGFAFCETCLHSAGHRKCLTR